jgi:hypothetical protein
MTYNIIYKTVWHCENCYRNNYILDSNCANCGRPYLREKSEETLVKKEQGKNWLKLESYGA